jgi:hypothetical protein
VELVWSAGCVFLSIPQKKSGYVSGESGVTVAPGTMARAPWLSYLS